MVVILRGRLHCLRELFSSEEILHRGCDPEGSSAAEQQSDLLRHRVGANTVQCVGFLQARRSQRVEGEND